MPIGGMRKQFPEWGKLFDGQVIVSATPQTFDAVLSDHIFKLWDMQLHRDVYLSYGNRSARHVIHMVATGETPLRPNDATGLDLWAGAERERGDQNPGATMQGRRGTNQSRPPPNHRWRKCVATRRKDH